MKKLIGIITALCLLTGFPMDCISEVVVVLADPAYTVQQKETAIVYWLNFKRRRELRNCGSCCFTLNYDLLFYEKANIGMQGLCGKILNEAIEKMEADEIVEIPDDADAETAKALLNENFIKLKTNCNLGTMNVAVHKIFFNQEALQEKIKKFEKLKEEKMPEELEAIFQNVPIDEDDDFYFDYGCSKNDARAIEALIGEQAWFDGLLRA